MFDLVIITHIPCFYKVNLFNKISENKKIMIIFISDDTKYYRSSDFLSKNILFNHLFLNNGFYEHRNKFSSIIKLYKFLKKIKYRTLIVSGWELPEFWLSNLFFGKHKGMILESSIYSSNTNIIYSTLKQIFINNLKFIITSGNHHLELLKLLNFNKDIRISHGVGIINKMNNIQKIKKYNKSFIYIGRVSSEKNLNFLIEVFNNLGDDYKLSIYGEGLLSNSFNTSCSQNIKYFNAIKNVDISSILLQYDYLILPSLSETWGLVVEEAIYYNTPVIVSNVCGCVDLIKNGFNGFTFDPTQKESLIKILTSINEEIAEIMTSNTNHDFINNKDIEQINCYY
jgi:glycosyltransferase involved in cell wall biosynthesis